LTRRGLGLIELEVRPKISQMFLLDN